MLSFEFRGRYAAILVGMEQGTDFNRFLACARNDCGNIEQGTAEGKRGGTSFWIGPAGKIYRVTIAE